MLLTPQLRSSSAPVTALGGVSGGNHAVTTPGRPALPVAATSAPRARPADAAVAVVDAIATEPRHLDRWNEQATHGANRITEGEQVTVGASTFSPLAWGIPGYRFTGGTATMHAGVELLVEQGSPDAGGVLTELTNLIDVAPVLAVAKLAQVKVEARHDDAYDKYYERAYHIPGFQAVAASGPGESTYFGGRIYAEGAFVHELGHVAGDLVSGRAWMHALQADDKVIAGLLASGTLSVSQLGPIEPDPARRARWTARLAPGGITGYGDSALRSGTPVEDICESLRLRTIERYFHGSMATYRDNATGAERAIGFGELYPNRAALLAALGPSVAEAQRARDRDGRTLA